MKKFIAAVILTLALSSSAQETYSVNLALQANVDKLNLGRVQYNQGVCSRLNLIATCNQAQACVAANVSGGASCTSNDAPRQASASSRTPSQVERLSSPTNPSA